MNFQPPDELVDKHLNAVLRAAGSGLRYYSMPKTISEMRDAMRAAMAEAVREAQVGDGSDLV